MLTTSAHLVSAWGPFSVKLQIASGVHWLSIYSTPTQQHITLFFDSIEAARPVGIVLAKSLGTTLVEDF